MKVKRVFILTGLGTTVLRFMARDLAHGFARNGVEAHVGIERYPGDKYTLGNASNTVQAWKPELILEIDHLRSENALAWPSAPVHVSWVQDAIPNLFDKAHVDAIRPQDFILSSFPGLADRLVTEAGYPKAQIHHLPVGANCDMFRPAPLPAGEFTVGFPCNIGAPATKGSPDRWRRRADPVKWLLAAGVKVKLWGYGWEVFDWARPHWHGVVPNGPELREAYQSCHAILHANSDTNLHQRVFEAVACERPVLLYALASDVIEGGIVTLLPTRVTGDEARAVLYPFGNADQLISAVTLAKNHGFPPGYAREFREAHDYAVRVRELLRIVAG